MNFDNPLIRIGGYVLFAFAIFFVALLVTFPDGKVKQIAAVQIEAQLEKNMKKNFDVSVGDLDFWWLWGIELENLQIKEIRPSSGDPGTSDDGGDGNGGDGGGQDARAFPLNITIPSVAARLAPIDSALNLGLAAKFYLGLGGGTVTGSYVRASNRQSIYVSLNDIALKQTRLLQQFAGLPFFGTLRGDMELEFALGKPLLLGGYVDLATDKLTIGPKKEVKIEALPLGYVEIPRTNIGNVRIKMNVNAESGRRPKLVVERFDSEGRDLQTQMWGSIQLANTIATADAELQMRIRLNPEFIQTNELSPILRMKEFQNGKKGDWYGFVVLGRLNSPSFKGAKRAADGPDKAKQDQPKPGKAPPNQPTPKQKGGN
jgi:type II secretion system protein N